MTPRVLSLYCETTWEFHAARITIYLNAVLLQRTFPFCFVCVERSGACVVAQVSCPPRPFEMRAPRRSRGRDRGTQKLEACDVNIARELAEADAMRASALADKAAPKPRSRVRVDVRGRHDIRARALRVQRPSRAGPNRRTLSRSCCCA